MATVGQMSLFNEDRSHARRGDASMEVLRPLLERGASRAAFPRGAWERSHSRQPLINSLITGNPDNGVHTPPPGDPR
ncbi:hypothetical protein C9I50_24880 [Pseudomonas prosekii]|nr:hypothetical protein C9I50_24880 [Pseudomonas prosekii]